MDFRKKVKKIIVNVCGDILDSAKSRCVFYHDIHSDNKFTYMSTPISLFEDHIKVIKDNGLKIVDKITEDTGQVKITFDDGFRGIYENIDVINRLDTPITIFIITSFIDKRFYLSSKEVQELDNNPLINIQSHTHTHQDLRLLSGDNLELELKKSKEILENVCNKTIDNICYPRGLFSTYVANMANQLGYTEQYSSIPGYYHSEVLPFVKRRSLVQFSDSKELYSILRGGDNVFATWYKFKHFNI